MKKVLIILSSVLIAISCQSPDSKKDSNEDPRVGDFKGKIAKTFEESVEDWPKNQVYTGEETNVLVLLLDDVGYGQLGAFGGLTPTPNIDALADNGLRFSNFHTTALCSPSRASIMTGRNHHSIGLGSHALTAMGFPGYSGRVPYSAQEVARLARDEGYGTYALGKWDHTPTFSVHQNGPFTYWPTQDGYEHTYNFMSADANNFTPVMYAGHEPIEPSKDDPDYHLSEDLADKAIHYLTGHVSLNPDKPFFMFWAPGAMHAPHHAPQEYIDRFKGKFDMGWDKARELIYANQKEMGLYDSSTKLTERMDDLPAWESLTAREKRIYAKQMETFAGQLAHVDEQIGRITETLKRLDKYDNTLIMVTSDNGASGEGGLSGSHNEMLFFNAIARTSLDENEKKIDEWGQEETYNHYHAAWAWAGNTPFKYFKQITHRGGQTDPMIIHWPKGIKDKGGIRTQFAHIIDVVPTIMDATGIDFREEIDGVKQMELDGSSMMYAFDDAGVKTQHNRQYFELFGNRAMVLDGWKAVTIHGKRMPWIGSSVSDFDDDEWELYNLEEDFSESTNLASEYPEKLEELKAEFEKEAYKYNVFPLYDDIIARIKKANEVYAPQRDEFVYYPPGAIRIPDAYSPPVKNKNHSITAHANITENTTNGVLLATGGIYGGYTFFVKDNKLYYEYNAFNEDRYQVVSDVNIPKGEVEMKAVYKANAEEKTAVVELYINGEMVGEGTVDRFMFASYSISETFDVGVDMGSSVSKEYTRDNEFSGELHKVIVKLL
ncbi:MAG: sulfatase-like hydrolase/transferase [Eudoraea sp.]|nr:sulfatase-like hydrolase/transferase [Eudoraea sp.]